MEYYHRLEKLIFKIEQAFVTVLLAVSFVAVFVQVFARYFFLPIIDTTEFSMMSLPMLAFMGLGLCTYTDGSISIEIVSLIRNKWVRFVLIFVRHIIMLLFVVVYVFMARDLIVFVANINMTTLELRIPLLLPYVTLMAGLVFMGIHTIGGLLRLLSGIITQTEETTNSEEERQDA